MHLDTVFDYLRRCGGQDTLVFDTPQKAGLARLLLIKQFEADEIEVDDRPALDVFDNQLRIRLRKGAVSNESVSEAQEVRG